MMPSSNLTLPPRVTFFVARVIITDELGLGCLVIQLLVAAEPVEYIAQTFKTS